MCVSSQSSLVLFVSGVISSLALIYTTRQIEHISVFFIHLMQLAEYVMWIDIENGYKHGMWNRLGNYIGIASLFMQLVSPSIINPKPYSNYVIILNSIIYTVVTWLYFINKSPKSTIGKKGHLKWGLMRVLNPYIIYSSFIVFVLSQLFNIYNYLYDKIPFIAQIVSILFSMKLINSINPLHFGSFWCYIGSIMMNINSAYLIYLTL